MSDCIFCKIRDGDIPSDIIYQDENYFVIKDINPKARIHNLVIPKRHIRSLNDTEDKDALSGLLLTARKIAKELGIDRKGYRLILNCEEGGGQSVFHLHVHLLGGEVLTGF